jgi:carbamoyltransferase
MKFLGIRNGHDCNVTYTDGIKVRYLKLERNLQIKHYLWDEYNHIDDMTGILDEVKRILKIDFFDLDGICVNESDDRHEIQDKLSTEQLVKPVNKSKNLLWDAFSCPVYVIDHHYAHMLSCWPLVDVSKVNTHLVVDGEGNHTRTLSIFKNNELVKYNSYADGPGFGKLLEELGKIYGLGGSIIDHSGKVMALKSFHDLPDEYIAKFIEDIKDINYDQQDLLIKKSRQSYNEYFKDTSDDDLKQITTNVAFMYHLFAEKKLPNYLQPYVDNNNDVITYSGGVAQNTVVNTKLKKQYPNMVIPPHCPDDGISLGCVEYLRQLFDQDPFDNNGFPYWQSDKAPIAPANDRTINKAAELLAQGKIIGWYQGYGEIGPRALGNRSILMDPSVAEGKALINKKVKNRESFRPFGASVLAEHSSKYFDCDFESPYMLYVVDCLTKEFPSVVHVDNTCRIQTVNQEPQYETYYKLIDKFYRLTGKPLVLNTSLNIDGKPIAAHPNDAKKLFKMCELDAMFIGDEYMIKGNK